MQHLLRGRAWTLCVCVCVRPVDKGTCDCPFHHTHSCWPGLGGRTDFAAEQVKNSGFHTLNISKLCLLDHLNPYIRWHHLNGLPETPQVNEKLYIFLPEMICFSDLNLCWLVVVLLVTDGMCDNCLIWTSHRTQQRLQAHCLTQLRPIFVQFEVKLNFPSKKKLFSISVAFI